MDNLSYNPRSRRLRQPTAARRRPNAASPAAQPAKPKAQPKVESSRFRLILVWLVLVVGGVLLATNLFRLQVTQSAKLRQQAREQQMVFLRPFVPRRPIVDRTNAVLAIDRPVYTLYAHPKLFKRTKVEVAGQLSPVLKRPAGDIVKQFDRAESGIRIEYALDEWMADRITNLQIDGLELIQNQQRLYPQQDLMAGVLGYVDVEHQGQAGLEFSQQKFLERSVKAIRLSRMGNGMLMPDSMPGGFLHVDDLRVQLTLDSRLHRVAQASLREQMKLYNAKRGTVIVMDVKDGSLLALVTEPSYDPNRYYEFPVERFKNWAITDLYEPGSTFKPINVAIALEAGAMKPDAIFNDEGQIFVDGWPIEDFDFSSTGGRGPLSVTEILQYSSNVGMVHIVQQLKPKVYYNWLKRLGLGQVTGIDLPSEIASRAKDKEQFLESPIEAATASFGQGFSITPLKLAQLATALANGGKLVTPHIVRGLYDTEGQLHSQPTIPPPRQVFSPATTQAVLKMMEAVVTEGTGKPAQIEGYRIAGKTGTAQKASADGGYYETAKITSFVSIFPVDAPRFVVVAVIDEPEGGDAFGSTVAAPIVKTVMEALITIEQIPPSTPQPKLEATDAPETTESP
jgi:cell division protein FtsI (penicillin-binding protein 3)